MPTDFSKYHKIHFIGIGGIGISAVARMLLLEGKEVSGSDRDSSEITEELKKEGAKIFIGQNAENIDASVDLVVFTVAIPEDNPELKKARELNIPLLTYPETLEVISRGKYTIAVSGTHGKTTTTAMVAQVLIEAGLDPTVLVGSLMRDPKNPNGPGTNFILGKSKYFVVEADEYKKSFLHLLPTILVVNNIDEDHLDFYKDLADIQNSFRELAERVPSDGYVICNTDDLHVMPVIDGLKCKVINYLTLHASGFTLHVPGVHNQKNAAAAFAVGKTLGIPEKKIHTALENFRGTWRRFEYKGKTKSGALVYDDYAHNPQKVRSALEGAREMYPDKFITAVFQPHLYSRTKTLLPEFATSFNNANRVLLVPIYAAREAHDPEITSEILSVKIGKNVSDIRSFHSLEEIKKYILENPRENEIILLMGAGDINTITTDLVTKP